MPHDLEWQGRPTATEWKSGVRPILEHFVERTPGSLIEEKEFALVWHYRMAEPDLPTGFTEVQHVLAPA